MAVATIPVLGAYTLPAPKEQNYTRFFRGGTLVMASGKIVHDLVDTSPLHSFSLRWEFLTEGQLNTIIVAWEVIKNATALYTSINGNIHQVTQPDGAVLDIQPVVTAGAQIRYHVSMELVEDH